VCSTALITSSNRQFTETILDHFKWRSYFDVVITGDDVKHGKPNPEPVLLALKKFGVSRGVLIGDTEYDPAPSRLTLVMVYPEGQPFLSVSMKADPDVIDPDVGSDGTTFGFTYIEVTVTNENGDPVNGATVGVSVSPAIPVITPAEATTDADGKVTFTLTATDLPNDDGSIVEYLVTAYARDTNNPDVKPGDNSISIDVVDRDYAVVDDSHNTPFPTFIMVASLFCVAAVGYGVIRRKK
jgi:hypothetical protein